MHTHTVWFQHGRLELFTRNVYIYMVFEIVSFQVNSPCKLGFEDFSLWPSIFTVSRHVQAVSTVWKEPTMISFTARPADVQGDHSNIAMCYNNVAIKLYDLIGLSELTFAKPAYDAINWPDVISCVAGLSQINIVYGFIQFFLFLFLLFFCCFFFLHLLRKLNLSFLPTYHQICCGLNNLAGTYK